MRKLSVLLIEDDVMIGAALAEMLADLGYETDTIQATEEGAVAAAERHRPDLMIVDLKLAMGTGIAAVERITRAAPIPHVFMSGLGARVARPGDVMLAKPFREADLIRAIARALDQASVAVTE